MKIVAAGSAVLAAGLILAQEGPRDGRGPGGPGGMSVLVRALDTDGDGTISGKEMKAAPASLKKLDKNGDGKLTEDELRPEFGGRGEGRWLHLCGSHPGYFGNPSGYH